MLTPNRWITFVLYFTLQRETSRTSGRIFRGPHYANFEKLLQYKRLVVYVLKSRGGRHAVKPTQSSNPRFTAPEGLNLILRGVSADVCQAEADALTARKTFLRP